jgi:hypothetical protein
VERLEARQDEALRLIGERNYRVWRIYMAGSAYAFERNWLALFQILAGRPRNDGVQEYPFTRHHVYLTCGLRRQTGVPCRMHPVVMLRRRRGCTGGRPQALDSEMSNQ